MNQLPRYDRTKSYAWNYEHAPEPVSVEVPAVDGDWQFCGLKVDSPLGIPAGPLLNGSWCLYYASLGFDVLTYKTVRSGLRECYPLPNLVPVDTGPLSFSPEFLPATDSLTPSWAVAFGMPSASPDRWRADVHRTKDKLGQGKVLSVSVVGTMQDGWTIDELAADYALCAKWAVESGADSIEANFSCPNVATCDGQLYQNIKGSALVANAIRASIGDVPLLIKIGHLSDLSLIKALIGALDESCTAFVMTNGISSRIKMGDELIFDGQPRGICGAAIRDESIAQVGRFQSAKMELGSPIEFIGVGGIAAASDVRGYLDAGAHACQLATSIMHDPEVGLKIRRDM